jgi:tol-pal system protein YbgF
LVDQNAQMRRGLLDLQQQNQSLRDELARLRGQQEQMAHDMADQATARQALEDRVNKLESGGTGQATQTTDSDPGAPGTAAPSTNAAAGPEKQEYDAALGVFRSGDFNKAQAAFADFVKRHPSSSLAPSALFWLGNAQYATRNYKEAIANFRSLLATTPNHPRAPEALLAIANCQIELKDQKAARATLESLIKSYPQSEAAQTGRDRLAKLK